MILRFIAILSLFSTLSFGQSVLDGIYVNERKQEVPSRQFFYAPILKKEGVKVYEQTSHLKNGSCHNTYLYYGDKTNYSLYYLLLGATYDGAITPFQDYDLGFNKLVLGLEKDAKTFEENMFSYIDFKRNVDSTANEIKDIFFKELLFVANSDTQRRIISIGFALKDTVWYSYDEIHFVLSNGLSMLHWNQDKERASFDSLLVNNYYCPTALYKKELPFEEAYFGHFQKGIQHLNNVYHANEIIEEVDLKNANISELPYYINTFNKVEKWQLQNNLLKEIPDFFFTMDHLSYLNLHNNLIRNADLNHWTLEHSITELSLSNNDLSSISFPTEYLNIKVLDLSNNHLSTLDGKWKYYSRIEEIILTGNPIDAKVLNKLRKKLPNTNIVFE